MLDKHVRSVHLKERPYSCHLCDKRFGQKVHLEVHMNGVHMKERPYGELKVHLSFGLSYLLIQVSSGLKGDIFVFESLDTEVT